MQKIASFGNKIISQGLTEFLQTHFFDNREVSIMTLFVKT